MANCIGRVEKDCSPIELSQFRLGSRYSQLINSRGSKVDKRILDCTEENLEEWEEVVLAHLAEPY